MVMKFGNGCWLYKEGCEGFSPAEVSDVRIGGDSAVLLMPASHISHRGDTLGGVMLTLRISSPLRDVIRVQVFHHEGALDKGPSFETAENPCDTFSLEESEDDISIKSRIDEMFEMLKLLVDRLDENDLSDLSATKRAKQLINDLSLY